MKEECNDDRKKLPVDWKKKEKITDSKQIRDEKERLAKSSKV